MKKLNVLALLFLGFLYSSCFAGGERFHIAYDYWPPYNSFEEPLNENGFVVLLNKIIFREANIPLKSDIRKWTEVLAAVSSGEADATVGGKTPERESFAYFSDPLFPWSFNFIYKKENGFRDLEWDTYLDIKSYTIGLIKGFSYGNDFYTAVYRYGLTVKYVDTPQENIANLMAGKVDIVAMNPDIFKWMVSQESSTKKVDFGVMKKPIIKHQLYIILSKKSKWADDLPRINKAIGVMKNITQQEKEKCGLKNITQQERDKCVWNHLVGDK